MRGKWLVFVLLFGTGELLASEGGGSHYQPGSRGDFAMAVLGESGWYVRNEMTYIDTSIDSVTLGKELYSHADQKVAVDTLKLIYISDKGILGSRSAAIVSIPYVFDAKVNGALEGSIPVARSGNKGGMTDLSLTGALNWNSGNNHYTAGMSLYLPTGQYDAEEMINLGRNYTTINPFLAYTWLDPKSGRELSLGMGYLWNSENSETDYQSGSEIHVDLHLAQHFSAQFALGLDGYYYKQITGDEGPFLDSKNRLLDSLGKRSLGSFKGEAYGVGPALKYTFTAYGEDINIILKWIRDIETTNRFKGDNLMLGVAFKF
jgi:hypothetical protein